MGASCFSVSGNPAVVKSPAVVPIDSLKVHFLPVQGGSGDPSPSNVRNTHGLNFINAYQSGVNLLPFDDVIQEGWTNTADGVTMTYSHGVMSVTGTHSISGWTNVASFDRCWSSAPIVLPPGKYIMSASVTSVFNFCVCCKIDGAAIANKASTFTAHQSVEVYGFYFAVKGEQQFNYQCPLVFTAGTVRPTEYKQYQPIKTIPIEFEASGKNLFDKSTGIQLQNKNIRVARSKGQGIPFHMHKGVTYTVSSNSETTPSEIGIQQPYSGTYYKVAYGQPSVTYTPDEDVDVGFNIYWEGSRPNDADDIQVEIGSQKTTFESYTNYGTVRKNLYNPDMTISAYVGDKITSYAPARTAIISVEAGKTYTISKAAGARLRIGYTATFPHIGDNVTGYTQNDTTSATVTVPSGMNYMCVFFAYANLNDDVDAMIASLQVEEGSTATAYEPYRNVADVYGGYVDPVEGKIVVEYVKIAPTKEQFATAHEYGIGYRQTSPIYAPTASGVKWGDARAQQTLNKGRISNPYSESTYGDYTGVVFTMEASTTVAYARISEALYQTLEAGETVEFTYKLANPITYYFNPRELKAIKEVSSYWSDAGQNVDVTYDIVDSAEMLKAKQRAAVNAPHSMITSEEAVPGNVATFNTNMKNKIKTCGVIYMPYQTGSGTPAVDNVMPISTKKELSVKHTGRAIAQLAGYSCGTMQVKASPSFTLIGNFGTTINTVAPNIESDAVIITQSSWNKPETKSSYMNGYIDIGFYDLEFGRTYKVSFDVTDITSNPLNASLSDLQLCGPNGLGQTGPYAVNGNRVTFRLNYRQYTNNPNSYGMEFRTCGMSFTLSHVIITADEEENQSYEPYINPCGKNVAFVYGYGAANMSSNGSLQRTNNGTTLSTTTFVLPDLPVVITQSTYDQSLTDKSDYHNGYMVAITPRLVFGKKYNISFKITDIVNNPLSATLANFKLVSPAGNHYPNPTVVGDRVIFYDVPYSQYEGNGRCGWDIRFCGMSCTLSEFMATEVDDDPTTFEPYRNNPYTVPLPPLGKNLFPCRESDMISSGWNRYFPNPIHEAGTYTISCQRAFGGTGDKGSRVVFINSNQNGGNVIGSEIIGYHFGSTANSRTFTVTEAQAKAPFICFQMMSSESTFADILSGQVQIEKGSSATSFEMYSEQVCGVLNLTTGELMAAYEHRAARWGDIKSGNPNSTTGLQQGSIRFSHNVVDAHFQSYYGQYTFCNVCGTIKWSTGGVSPTHYHITDNVAYFFLPSTTSDDLIIEIIDVLQEPIIMQLDPVQIKTLLGYNAFHAGSDEHVLVHYWTH